MLRLVTAILWRQTKSRLRRLASETGAFDEAGDADPDLKAVLTRSRRMLADARSSLDLQ